MHRRDVSLSADELEEEGRIGRTASIHPSSRASSEGEVQRGVRDAAGPAPSVLQLAGLERTGAFPVTLQLGLGGGVGSGANPSSGTGSGAASPAFSAHSASGSAVDSDTCRPSPQLLAALHATSPQQAASAAGGGFIHHSSDETLQYRWGAAQSSGISARTFTTPPTHLAGRLPPRFALERPALDTLTPSASSAAAARSASSSSAAAAAASSYWSSPLSLHHQHQHPRHTDSPTTSSGPSTPPPFWQQHHLHPHDASAQTRARSMSLGATLGNGGGGGGMGRGFGLNLTPPIGAAALARRNMLLRQSFDGLQLLHLPQASSLRSASLTGLEGDLEDNEDQQLLPGSSMRILRHRAHSNAGTHPPAIPSLLNESYSWSTHGSRIMIYCASGILFLLLFLFFSVVALRMAAHVKYDNEVCIARSQEKAAAAAAAVAAAEGGRATTTTAGGGAETTKGWVPNYEPSTWDKEWMLKSLTAKWTREALSPSSSAPSSPASLALSPSDLSKRARSLLAAGDWLEHLRLHHFTVIGTHNSYHLASELPIPMHQYTHQPLDKQLEGYRRGIRQLELDLHIIQQQKDEKQGAVQAAPSAAAAAAAVAAVPGASALGSSSSSSSTPGSPSASPSSLSVSASAAPDSASSSGPGSGFVVYHLQWLDDRTSCYCLSECLDLISQWSRSHPSHFPIYLTFEIKAQIWEDVDTGLRGFGCGELEEVEREIAASIPKEQLLWPREVRGKYATVKEALGEAAKIEAQFAALLDSRKAEADQSGHPLEFPTPAEFPKFDFGWPRLQQALGKIVVIWLDDFHNRAERLDCVVGGGAWATRGAPGGGGDAATQTSAATPVESSPAADGSSSSSSSAPPSPPPSPNPDPDSDPPSDYSWFHRSERLIFVAQNSVDAEYASVVTAKHPMLGMSDGTIREARNRGMMIRTMTGGVDLLPDPARFAAALHSGAHMLTTDFEECVERDAFHEEPPAGTEGSLVVAASAPAPAPAPTPAPAPDAMPVASSTDVLAAAEAQAGSGGRRLLRSFTPQSHVHGLSHAPFAATLAGWIGAGSTHASSSRRPLAAGSPGTPSGSSNGGGGGGGGGSVPGGSSSSVYCERLEGDWPFQCNQLSAPFFCAAALEAVRVQKELRELDEAQKRTPKRKG